ncbi:cytochrome P450 4V2-like isoform X2 [Stegodyphus dumicola]|uniref:cytochrome P450 4V2-like isoform X2 n=1 Tax=Stegodyphus dumicola TaxID=202533 RepID=UPI0015ABC0D4|nr:cytochrome P450 4V2-like isoform X2 [Stegodyphus dumicola]
MLEVFLYAVLLISGLFIGLTVAFYTWYASLESTKAYNRLPNIKVHLIITYWKELKKMYSTKQPLVLLNNSAMNTKSTEYRFLEPWLGTGLLTSSGEKWRTRRKLLTPSFHFRILMDFLVIFNEQSQVLVKKIGSLGSNSATDIVPLIKMCTLDIICETAMGVHINAQLGGCSEYVTAINEISDTFLYRLLRPWLWNEFIYCYFFPSGWKHRKNLNLVHQFTRKMIKEKKEFLLKNYTSQSKNEMETRRKAFLELLLENHFKDDKFTVEDVREEVDTFMFEGHDTTAMGISWALYNLGLYPDIQRKVIEELDSILQEDKERSISFDDLSAMKYMECVIKESLRLFPPVTFIGRNLNETITVMNYEIPAGTNCVIVISMIHRDPEMFPNPEKFDPDRFLPENSVGRHPFAYIPFSAGPRNCIGQKFALMEEKVVIAQILRKFQLISLDPLDRIDIMTGLVSKNVQPLRMRFIPRD